MRIIFDGLYKSITHIDWQSIPMLAVITGPNGSGKTQLLELIAEGLKPTPSHIKNTNTFKVEGRAFEPVDVEFLKGDWGINDIHPITVADLVSQHKNHHSIAFSNFDNPNRTNQQNNYRESSQKRDEYYAFARSLGKQYRYLVTYDEFCERYPIDQVRLDTPIHKQILDIFLHYKVRLVDEISKGATKEAAEDKLGPAPWDLLRGIIKGSSLPFEINDPSDISILSAFELKLTHTVTKQKVNFKDLSSGEKILISLLFYLYRGQDKNIFPKIILMDEPDAHLHPSMTHQFLNVIQKVFVEGLGIQVIMTTHSPSTVMLCQNESLFEMSIHEPRIRLSPSKNHSMHLLTAGLVYVNDATKYFLVEDAADVAFYNFVYRHLVDKELLTPEIPLAFIKASTDDKNGGKSVVKNWVEKLGNSGLTNIVQGLIDKDQDNKTGNGIFRIERYSIENYLVDPLVIYAALLEEGKAPQLNGINIAEGEEYKIAALDDRHLQSIVDAILNKIEPSVTSHFKSHSKKNVPIKYTNRVTVNLPQWLFDKQGKIILNEIIGTVYSSRLNHGSLFKAFRRLKLIPDDLVETFQIIQKQTT